MSRMIDLDKLIELHYAMCTGDCGICPDVTDDDRCGVLVNYTDYIDMEDDLK